MAEFLELLMVATLDSGGASQHSNSQRSKTPSKSVNGSEKKRHHHHKKKGHKRSSTPVATQKSDSLKKMQMFRDDSMLHLAIPKKSTTFTKNSSSEHEDKPLLSSSEQNSVSQDEDEKKDLLVPIAVPIGKVPSSEKQEFLIPPPSQKLHLSRSEPEKARGMPHRMSTAQIDEPEFKEMRKYKSAPVTVEELRRRDSLKNSDGREFVIEAPELPDSLHLSEVDAPKRANRMWKSSLCCAWTDQCSFCMYSLFCPCCAFGDNVQAARGEQGRSACISYCMVNLLCLGCVLAAIERSFVRKKLGLFAGCGGCEDLCVHTCCSCCAFAQMKEQIEHEKDLVREALFNQKEQEHEMYNFSSSMKRIVSAPKYLEG
jgi:Cys-rich protein (TIGR01571 family)